MRLRAQHLQSAMLCVHPFKAVCFQSDPNLLCTVDIRCFFFHCSVGEPDMLRTTFGLDLRAWTGRVFPARVLTPCPLQPEAAAQSETVSVGVAPRPKLVTTPCPWAAPRERVCRNKISVSAAVAPREIGLSQHRTCRRPQEELVSQHGFRAWRKRKKFLAQPLPLVWFQNDDFQNVIVWLENLINKFRDAMPRLVTEIEWNRALAGHSYADLSSC